MQRLLEHPEHDRFDHDQFCAALNGAGLDLMVSFQLWGAGGWFIAEKRGSVAAS